ncbi:MAG: ArsR family transcriptional regulator [Candidatus Thorarchaeota archaeon]|nr:ArsR family transcriptional regulator [Candidatus Thorarchaeota archaeon]
MRINRRAYLHWIRNVERGLVTRSEIIEALDSEIWRTVSEISASVRVGSATVSYHLRNMEREGIADRNNEGSWRLGPSQQANLIQFLKKSRNS